MSLSHEKETLLIPLYGKAMARKAGISFFEDPKAEEIVAHIDYDFQSLKIAPKTNLLMCLRAKLLDNYIREFLRQPGEKGVLHLGCGLDSRYGRIGDPSADWYDVDFEEVIDIRRHFYPETDRYHLIPSSVTEDEWVSHIPQYHSCYLVVAEGLFMYLQENEIATLLRRLKARVGEFTLIFDAFSTLTARRVKDHPSLKETGAKVYWGIDDAGSLSNLVEGVRFIKEIAFSANEEVPKLGWGMRLGFKLAHLFPMARKAHGILLYEVRR